MINRSKPPSKKQTALKNRAAKSSKKTRKEKIVGADAPKTARGNDDFPSSTNARLAARLNVNAPREAVSRPPEGISAKSATPTRVNERRPLIPKSEAREARPTPPARRLAAVPEPVVPQAPSKAPLALAVDQKLLEIARDNVVANFDFALRLIGARTPFDVARLQVAFLAERLKAFATQVGELNTLLASSSGRRVGR
jgi:hypothetical protein